MSERKTGSGERQDAEQPEAVEQNEPQGRTLKFPELPERRSLMGGVMFRKKLARARAFQKERSGESEEAPEEDIPLEKHDVSTMIFSALLTIVPICLGIRADGLPAPVDLPRPLIQNPTNRCKMCSILQRFFAHLRPFAG